MSPVLIGHSMGGMLIQQYLANNNAPGAVLMASVPPKRIDRSYWRLFLAEPWPFLYAMLIRWDFWWLFSTPARAHRNLFSEETPRALMERHRANLQPESYRVFLDISFSSFGHHR